jgi:hypothetical protein
VVLDPVDPKNGPVIPLELVGVTSVFSVRIPTLQEFKDDENDSDYEDEITDSGNDEVDFEKDDSDNAGLLVLVK